MTTLLLALTWIGIVLGITLAIAAAVCVLYALAGVITWLEYRLFPPPAMRDE